MKCSRSRLSSVRWSLYGEAPAQAAFCFVANSAAKIATSPRLAIDWTVAHSHSGQSKAASALATDRSYKPGRVIERALTHLAHLHTVKQALTLTAKGSLDGNSPLESAALSLKVSPYTTLHMEVSKRNGMHTQMFF